MANLMDLVNARKKLQHTNLALRRVLIYGQPKSGKTFLAATIARVPSIKHIYWFDLENGSSTLLNPELGLTPEQMSKIELYNIPDTKDNPIGIETMLKVLSNKVGITICEEHGKVNCTRCKVKGKASSTFPAISTLDSTSCIVTDSFSQLGDSAFVVGCRLAEGNKNAFAKYVEQGKLLSDLFSMLQQSHTNIIGITQVTTNEAEDTKKETVIPLCGTRNFSLKVSKYFSTVIYRHVELKEFKTGSSPIYKMNTIAGDRLGIKLEEDKDPSMEGLF